MPALRGITVAVGEWYARTLDICLVKNMRHLTSCLVVTAPGDDAVKAVVARVPGASVFETDAFYRPDAKGVRPAFNKSHSLELAFDVLGREGYILIHDADVLLPDSLPLDKIRPDMLHGARRRILEDPSLWSPSLDWNTCPVHRDGGPIGFFQLLNAADPAIRDKRPWYHPGFGHAGGGDAYVITHWPRNKLTVLPLEVLHLGPPDSHWFGATPEGRDLMAKFVTANGWQRAAARFTPEQVARAGEVVHRIEVPGYPVNDFDLPFVKRAEAQRRGRGT